MKIECRDVRKNYKKKEVLKGIDLVLEKGKIYGLIGRNGAGKTTLLSILSAQNPASFGNILLDGREIWENAEALSHIYFAREIITSSNSNASGLKVKEYLKLAETYLPRWDKDMAQRLTELFHLDRKQRITKLSKGMVSMLQIVVALASKADFTFLDEPVSGLDVVAREAFYRLLLEEFTETERTFVISTHIIEEAADIFEEVIFLHEGKILLKENTQDLLEHSVYVSGKTEAVDRLIQGKQIYCPEVLGRSKSALVRLREGERLSGGRGRYPAGSQSPENLCGPVRRGGTRMRKKKSWFYHAADNLCGMALFLGILLVLIAVRREEFSWESAKTVIHNYFSLPGIVLAGVLGAFNVILLYESTEPLKISFGCTRKQVFRDMQAMKIATLFTAGFLSFFLSGQERSRIFLKELLFWGLLLLFLQSICECMSILGMRYKGLMLVSILCISGIIGFVVAFMAMDFIKNGEIHMEWPISGVLENWLLWAAVFLLGTILLVFFSWKFFRKAEVHI